MSLPTLRKDAAHFPQMCGVFLLRQPKPTRFIAELAKRFISDPFESLGDFRYVPVPVSSASASNFTLQISSFRPVPSNHFDDDGNVHMVDVSAKPVTKRVATASSRITMNASAADLVRKGTSRKGDVLAVARLAAINATKWTSHLIPLCHTIPIESVQIDFQWAGEPLEDQTDHEQAKTAHQLICRVTCSTSGKTGIEMEALTGASVGSLAVYDMLKSVDREMLIGPTQLEEKDGGRSGSFSRGTRDNPPQTTRFVDTSS